MVDNDGVGGRCGVMDARRRSGTAGDNQTTSRAQRGEHPRDKAIAADPETGEILAGQTLDATREHRYRKPANDVNDAPRQM